MVSPFNRYAPPSDEEREAFLAYQRLLAQQAEKQPAGATRSFSRSQFPPPIEDESTRLSREVRLLEGQHIGPDQASQTARDILSDRPVEPADVNPASMTRDFIRSAPEAAKVFGGATLMAAYPVSLAGSGAATMGAEKAGLGPNWQTAAGIVGGIAEGPRAVMGARKVTAPLGGIGNPLAGAGRNIAKPTQKLGTAAVQAEKAAIKAEGQIVRGMVNGQEVRVPVGAIGSDAKPTKVELRAEKWLRRGGGKPIDIQRRVETRQNGYKVVRDRPEGWDSDQYARPMRGFWVEAPDGTKVKIPISDAQLKRPEANVTLKEARDFADSQQASAPTAPVGKVGSDVTPPASQAAQPPTRSINIGELNRRAVGKPPTRQVTESAPSPRPPISDAKGQVAGQYGFGGEVREAQPVDLPESPSALRGPQEGTPRLSQEAVDAVNAHRDSPAGFKSKAEAATRGLNTKTRPYEADQYTRGAYDRQAYLDPEGRQVFLTPEEVEIANSVKLTNIRNVDEELHESGWIGKQLEGPDVKSVREGPEFTKFRPDPRKVEDIPSNLPGQRGLLNVGNPVEELQPTGRISGPPKGPPFRPPTNPDVPRDPNAFPSLEQKVDPNNIIGMPSEIAPELTRGNKVENALMGVANKVAPVFHLNNKFGTAVTRFKTKMEVKINSQGTQLSMRQASALRRAFKLEDDLYVPALKDVPHPGTVQGMAPSLDDIASFPEYYNQHLSPQQRAALQPVIAANKAYKELLQSTGITIRDRPSTMIGEGEYIPRVAKGHIDQSVVRNPPTKGLFKSPLKSFEKEQGFLTSAEGRAAGYKYAGIEEALKSRYIDAGQRAAEQHASNFLLKIEDANWPISVPRTGESGALRSAIDMPTLTDKTFPDAVAASVNKVLVNEGATLGQGRQALEAIRILNRGYRSVRASLDNSVMGIQMLLSAYAHPIAASRAAAVNFRAWRDPNVLAKFIENFDVQAVKNGRLTSSQWVAKGGAHLGSTTGEFADAGIQKLPGFKQAGRAFGYTGDAGRLSVSDVLLEQEMHGFKLFGKGPEIGKGRTLAEIEESGDLARIGEIANKMTGIANKRFGGDVGEILLFAPRFLQSRMETLAKGMAGLRPGASLDQKIARRSLLKMIALGTSMTVAINELNGEETDFRVIVDGKKNPNFMRIRALGRDWSMFGTWDSLVGLLIATGHADGEGMLRSQASGLVALAWDNVSGADFTGRSTVGAENKSAYILRQFLPFSTEGVVGGVEQTFSGKPDDIVSGAATAAGSFAGVKSSPESFVDNANEIAQSKYGTTWDRLSVQRRAALDKAIAVNKTTSPEYARLDKVMDDIAEQVDKTREVSKPLILTLNGRREYIARERYGMSYGDLFPSMKVAVNKKVAEIFKQGKSGLRQFSGNAPMIGGN